MLKTIKKICKLAQAALHFKEAVTQKKKKYSQIAAKHFLLSIIKK